MKKQLFSIVMMLALVVVAGSAWAQSTLNAPYVGSSYTYTVTGVTGASYAISVTTTTADHPSEIAANLVATEASVSANTGSAGYSNESVTADIQWNTAGTYHIWLAVTSSDNCTNYVYKAITILDQTVEYEVFALGRTASDPTDGTGGNTVDSECFDEEDNTYADNSTTLGTTVIYYAVKRTADEDDSWQFTPSITGTYSAVTYGETTSATGTTWETADGEITIPSGTELLYFAVTVANGTSDLSITFAATNYDEVSTTVEQTVTTNDSAIIELQGLPTVGTFSGF